jgi:hypothetical protein
LKEPSDGTQIAAHDALYIGLAIVDEPAFGGAPKGGRHAVQRGSDGRGRGGYFFNYVRVSCGGHRAMRGACPGRDRVHSRAGTPLIPCSC